MRLRDGEQRLEGRAERTGGLSAMAMDGRSERGLRRQFTTGCVASNRGGSAWCLLSQKAAMSRAVRPPSRARAYNVVFTLERETLSELLLLLWRPLWGVSINIVLVIGFYSPYTPRIHACTGYPT